MVCAILALGGLAKVASPSPARVAIRAMGVNSPLWLVRALGAAEVALAVAAAVKGGEILPIVVGMAYLAFAAVVVVIIRGGTAASCGCFGSSATPPSILHVAVNLTSAAVAFGSTGMSGLRTTLQNQAGSGLPLVLLVVVGTYALFLLLTALPVVLGPPQTQIGDFALIASRDQRQ